MPSFGDAPFAANGAARLIGFATAAFAAQSFATAAFAAHGIVRPTAPAARIGHARLRTGARCTGACRCGTQQLAAGKRADNACLSSTQHPSD
ncbi:MAG TPA: hypothetical protein VND19_02635 [Acetobacteraceae bacterium]|nr:hypothetical protein [Acetobacteraceae bacterium]